MSLVSTLLDYFTSHSQQLKKGSRLLVACSGGPDSVGLAFGLKKMPAKFGYQFRLAHVDHGLRGAASKKDVQFVRQLAGRLGWPFDLSSQPISKNESGNLEEKARVKRYEALHHLAKRGRCRVVLTAHNKDDQVETILMNLARGTGLDGLSGMSPLRKLKGDVFIGRPLLSFSKDEILDFVHTVKAPFRVDQTNHDATFMRNWIRQRLVPMWEARSPGIKDRIVNLGQIIQDEQSHWKDTVKEVLALVAQTHQGGLLVDQAKLNTYPAALQRRIIRGVVGSDLLTFHNMERLRGWMDKPPSGRRHFQLKKGWVVERMSRSKGHPSAHSFWFHQTKSENKTKRKK